MLVKEAVRICLLMMWLLKSSSNHIFHHFKSKDVRVRNIEERERTQEPRNQSHCILYQIDSAHHPNGCITKIWDQNGTFVNETSGHGEHELCYDANRCYYVHTYNSIFDKCSISSKEDGENLKWIKVYGGANNLAQLGDCSSGKKFRHHLLLIDATSNGADFIYDRSINNEVIEKKIIVQGSEALMWIDMKECNTIDGTGNAIYKIYHYSGELYSTGDHSDYYSFGKCTCSYKSLFLSSSTRGRDIMTLLSSSWGMEVFTNVTSPQYVSACWLINHDLLKLSANHANIIQRYIIALLFHSTNGWNWNKDFGFMSNKHECKWNDGKNGFFCDDSFNGIKVIVDNNNLKGHLVSELYSLQYLENLHLTNHQLSGSLPFGISQVKLKTLNISGNNFQGSLPEDLFYMKSLEEINIYKNRLTGSLPNIDALFTNLTKLIARNNKLTGTIPNWIRSASNLTILLFQDNFMNGTIPHFIFELPKLDTVEFVSNQLSGSLPSNAFMNRNIAHIYLGNNRLSGAIPTEIVTNTLLEELFLDNNMITGTIATNLLTVPTLQGLRLTDNNLSGNFDFDYSGSNLRDLRIENNNLTGKIKNCKGYLTRADCGIPRKINCECCICYGSLSAPTAYEEVSQCASSVIVLFNTNYANSNTFTIRNNAKEVLVHDRIAPGQKYVTCLSETDCYTLKAGDWNGGHMMIDNTLVIPDIQKYKDYSFGYNGEQMLAKDECASYKVCGMTLTPDMPQRSMLDRLYKLYRTSDFMDTSTFHYKTLCWWLEDIEKNPTSNYTQRYVLALLHNSTDGEHWTNNADWLSNEHECLWYGVDCDKYKIILKVNLASNNLNGIIPTEVGELKAINELILSHNKLTGFIPSQLSKLERIEKLDLSSNKLQGSIPTYIHFLKYLKELDLSSNVLTNSLPLEMSSLQNIEVINLSNNSFSGELPNELSNWSKLEVFNISNNLFQGNADTLEIVTSIRLLDLSQNYFDGSPPIFGSERIEILHIDGNVFSGSIPPKIGLMKNLKEFFVHKNELRGTLPSEIGEIKNISKITINHNSIKGTIPSEIGNLRRLTHLHLHSNELEGDADYFNDHAVESFITDCGNTETTKSLVACKSCTQCCNEEEQCITETSTWPKNVIKSISSSFGMSSSLVVFVIMFMAWIIIIPITVALFSFKDSLPKLSCVHEKKHFQKESVYRFFLSSNKLGWFIALLTLSFQLWITWTFLNAGDRTSIINEWVFSVVCPNNSIECNDKRQVNAAGLVAFVGIILAFTIPDIFDGIYLYYESSTSNKMNVTGVIFGIILASVSVITIAVSFIYINATSISNAALLKDSVAILFLSDIDEKVFKIVIRLNSSWAEEIEKHISNHNVGLIQDSEILVSAEGNTVINVEQNEISREMEELKRTNIDVLRRMEEYDRKMIEMQRLVDKSNRHHYQDTGNDTIADVQGQPTDAEDTQST